MKKLTFIFSLCLASVALADDPAELVERRQAWEKQRAESQEKIDKMYFAELEELKKNFTKARNIPAALAVDNAIKGGEKAESEPDALTKVRQARNKSLKKALTPLDKKYWQDLKKLKEDFIKEGKLDGVVAADSEIEKVLAAYKKPEAPKKKAEVAKQVKEEAKEENPLNGKWFLVYNNGSQRTYSIKDDRITVDFCVIQRSIGEKAKLEKHDKGWFVTFKNNPISEYIFLEGNKMHVHHWMVGLEPLKQPHSHTATGTKAEEDKDE